MATCLTLWKFRFILQLYESVGLIETINEIVEYCASVYAYWLIILDSFVHRQAHKRFWQTVQQIDKHVCCLSHFEFRRYMAEFIEFFAIRISIIVINMILVNFERTGIYIAYMIPIQICQIRVFYYIFGLEAIQFQLECIEREIVRTRTGSSNSILAEVINFKRIRKNFECIYKSSDLLNTIFGFSQVAAVLFCFYSMFTDLNYIYIHFRELSEVDLIGKYSLVMIFCILLWNLFVINLVL